MFSFLKRIISPIAVNQYYLLTRSSHVVPKTPQWKATPSKCLPQTMEINPELVEYLERTSLVEFTGEDGVRQLKESIEFADTIRTVNTEGIEPMTSLHENETCYLREDEVVEETSREEIMKPASKTVEGWYFVSPPGNIPLKKEKDE